jgi:hypothetical protein
MWGRAVCAIAVTALAAGCGQAGDQPAAEPDPSMAPSSTSSEAPGQALSAAPTASSSAGAAGQATGTQRCHTAQLSARLGARAAFSQGGSTGQTAIPLVYTNTSKTGCQLHGVPGLDLHGPSDPNGPVYQLPRQDRGGNVTLAPGGSASARVVVLSYEQGSLGSAGSTRWTPTQLVTIPPGETTSLTIAWPAGLTVLRQDEATHPGSWIESFTAG